MSKARIFIGSSRESLDVAQRVKQYFTNDYDCFLWTDDVFKNNDSILETLMKSASLFDFGIMIFASDDLVTSRSKEFEQARDNVLFEYGLFLGRLGRDRAFIVVEDGIKIPSDLFGITHTIYQVREEVDGKKIATESLENGLEKLKKQADENINLGHLGLLPSTITAISYFDNFVKLTASWIMSNAPQITIGECKYNIGHLYIKLPDNLDSDIKDSSSVFYKKNGLDETTIDTANRSYPVHVSSKRNGDVLEIYDMPTILNGIDRAIDMYFRVGHIGKTSEQKLAEEHEMSNFKRVLQLLINENAFCRECVTILD